MKDVKIPEGAVVFGALELGDRFQFLPGHFDRSCRTWVKKNNSDGKYNVESLLDWRGEESDFHDHARVDYWTLVTPVA